MKETKIRWAGSTWNVFTGCTEVSPGCDRCYAKVIAEKFRGGPAFPVGFDPMVRMHRLSQPRNWKEPRRIFVNSMSDMHHDAFTTSMIDHVYDEMLEVRRHQYLVLTKRPKRMRAYLCGKDGWLRRRGLDAVPGHIWLGTTIENDRYTWRADALREIPVPIRFLSCEPLLGPLPSLDLDGISWVIVGGESGNGSKDYRDMPDEWATDLRDRCVAAGVAFYFKQHAAYRTEIGLDLEGVRWEQYPDEPPFDRRVAEVPAGRLLLNAAVFVCERGCCPGCGECYGMAIGCHADPCVCGERTAAARGAPGVSYSETP